jgi:hypothetical protein
MTLTRISAVAEIVSSIAIVVTLAYLAVQTQQNTQALLSSSRQGSLDAELSILYEILDKPYLYNGPLLRLPNTDFGEERLAQIATLNLLYFRTRENYWLQYRNGSLDIETWATYRDVLIRLISNRADVREVWSLFAGSLDPEFVAEINERGATRVD